MEYESLRIKSLLGPRPFTLCAVAAGILVGWVACRPCANFRDVLSIRGTVLDAATQSPLSDVLVGGRTFTDGVETGFISVMNSFGDPNVPNPGSDGSFELPFSIFGGGTCTGLFRPPLPLPEFSPPDQVEIVVLRGTCESRFTIEVGGDTIVGPGLEPDVLDLHDPILVPPCEP